MAQLDGLNGELTYAAVGDSNILEDASIFEWSLDINRRMVDTTLRNQSAKAFSFDHGFAVVDLKAYIDSSTNPGSINLVRATVVLMPTGSAAKKMTVNGWIERYRWECAIGSPVILVARLRSDSTATFNWT